MAVEKGNKIKVEYEGKFESGEVFDSSKKHKNPLEFTAGAGMVVQGFDKAVLGMNLNDEKEVTLPPEEAYGDLNKEAIQKVPKDNFPKEAREGMIIGIPLPTGEQVPAEIIKIDDKEVTIDLNHPLAGRTLVFNIKVVGIE